VGILGALDDAKRAAERTQDEPRGLLKLTCGVEFGMIAVSAWIAGYLQEHANVQIQADFTGRVIDLVHEGYDLAIRVGPLPDSSLAARKLGDLHYGLFASPDYLMRRGTPAHPSELRTHDRLVFSGASGAQTWLLKNDSTVFSVDASPRLRINNSFAVRDAAAVGMGIAQLPLVVAQASVDQGDLVSVLEPWRPAAIAVHAVYPSNRYLTPKVRRFIDHAVRAFATSETPALPIRSQQDHAVTNTPPMFRQSDRGEGTH
jgi:LysR family transcriptional regulator, regulator for bpeEF and oprC